MTSAERESFLADRHVGVITIAGEGAVPFAVPIWYAYEPGGLVTVQTGAETKKARLLRRAGRFRLVAQQEALPYKYVTVEGPVVEMGPEAVDPAERRAMAVRYLGEEGGDAYIASTQEMAAEIAIRMRPERWTSFDFSE
jgi:nitroimidazol reductase NimA-like FMN-containing flavoprotein (pyridoxamine 5'-phosphate oxidase superfamily)